MFWLRIGRIFSHHDQHTRITRYKGRKDERRNLHDFLNRSVGVEDDEIYEMKEYRGRWKKVLFHERNFSLERSDFSFQNVWYEFNGWRKMDESHRPYGPKQILADWEEKVVDFNLDFSHFADRGLISAHPEDLEKWAKFIDYWEILDDLPGDLNQENNLILLFLIELFLCFEHKRNKHEDLLDDMLRCFSRFAETWEVDWRTHLQNLGRMLYSGNHTSEERLEELLEVFGIKLWE